MAKKEQSFEESIQRLEEIVRRLESGEEPLDSALKLFEEGTRLVSSCTDLLDKAEQKVVRLVKSADGTPREEPFDSGEEA